MQRFVLILSFITFSGFQVFGLNANTTRIIPGQSVAIDIYWGYLQYHHHEMTPLKQGSAQAVKLSYIFSSNGNKQWHMAYNYPNAGISYTLMDLGQRSILGYAHSVTPFMSIPLFNKGKKFSFDFYTAAGVALMPKTFHPVSNSQNTAISTHINTNIDLGLSASYHVNNNLIVNAGAHITHFSNGSIKKPNYGLNYTLLSLGIQYGNFNAKPKNHEEKKVRSEKHRILLAILGSTKQAVAFNDPNFCVASGSIEYSHKVWSPLFRVGGSLDFMYDNSHSLILHNHSIAYGSDWELAKLGMAVNAELILNRLSLILHFGGYYHNLSRKIKNQWVYQRVGLRYRFTNGLWAHVALKTHLNIADYIEFGLAFKLF